MTRFAALSLLLASCAPRYVQPAAQPDPSPEVVAIEPSPGYWAAERRYESVELCTVMLHARSRILVMAGAGAQDTIDVARAVCWQAGVSAPFERLLAGGMKQQLERAADEAESAMERTMK